MSKRYCGMCDAWVKGHECPKCGADTDAVGRKLAQAVDLMEALRKSLAVLKARGGGDE